MIGRRTYAMCAITAILLIAAVTATVNGDPQTAEVCRTSAGLAVAGAIAALRAAK